MQVMKLLSFAHVDVDVQKDAVAVSSPSILINMLRTDPESPFSFFCPASADESHNPGQTKATSDNSENHFLHKTLGDFRSGFSSNISFYDSFSANFIAIRAEIVRFFSRHTMIFGSDLSVSIFQLRKDCRLSDKRFCQN